MDLNVKDFILNLQILTTTLLKRKSQHGQRYQPLEFRMILWLWMGVECGLWLWLECKVLKS
ncbi:hypothetical protein HanLR1_Chr14g0535051 [Helianthus annuus]|nr:hypothetical protein HanHA89_Chr14g0572641 [Helianthus annuus]KAJ0656370.1 hypothetical protein HanLR1_Chr14g0535051 [Helianthus annuus]